jgi:hypothetical protein
MIFVGIYGSGGAALTLFAKYAVEEPRILDAISDLEPTPDVFIKSLSLRIAFGSLASLAYCLAGLSVVLKRRRATLLVLVAAGLGVAKQLLAVGVGLIAGGLFAFLSVTHAAVPISIHLALAAIVYFMRPETVVTPGEVPHD